MSYSTLKDFALQNSTNLYAAFASGMLSSEEAKSDLIWQDNKEFIFEIIKKGFFAVLEEEVGTEFWKKWVKDNFLSFVKLWSGPGNKKTLLTRSVNFNEINVENYLTVDEEILKSLRCLFVEALECDAICYNDEATIRIFSQLIKLGEKEFYEYINSRKMSSEDKLFLITLGSDFFRFDKYYQAQKGEPQRIDVIYDFCQSILGLRVVKTGFDPKNEVNISGDKFIEYTEKLNAVRKWIESTSSKIDLYLFEAVIKTFVFGCPGMKRDSINLTFDWFKDNARKLSASLGEGSIDALFSDIVTKELTPVDEIIEKFSALENSFRVSARRGFAEKLIKHKFESYSKTEVEKLQEVSQTLDKLNTWTDVRELFDTSKLTFEDVCVWAAKRSTNPTKREALRNEISLLGLKFNIPFEKLKDILKFLKNAYSQERMAYMEVLNYCVEMEHPYIKRKDWLRQNLMDFNNSTGLNSYVCWVGARDWIRAEVRTFSTFFMQVTNALNTFNLKDPLDSLQKEVFNAYIGYVFYTDPDRLIVVNQPNNKRSKPTFGIRDTFIAEALEIAKSIKGGFDAKKYLTTQIAMIYFASKRKGKNLFQQYSHNVMYSPTTSLYYNQQGLFGLEVADPFEKGYSWGNYEKLAKMCRVTDYSNSSSYEVRAKRLAVYLLNYFVTGDLDALNAKLAQTEAKTLSRVVTKISRSLQGTQTYNTIVNNFEVLRSKRAEIIEYFADKAQHFGCLIDVCKMLIDTGKFINPSLLPYADMFGALSGLNLTEEDTQKYQNYMVVALKNKVPSSYVTRAIRYAGNFTSSRGDVPKKNIKAEAVVLQELGVKAKILDNGDLRALTIGQEISCCQYIDGYASSCAIATYEDPNYGIVLVDNIDQSKGSRPLAEAAVWISEGMVVIDSIEGLRKDASGYSKIAAAFDAIIKQWHAQGLRVGISTTDYGMTVQVCNKLRREFGYTIQSVNTPARPSRNIYTDVGTYVNEFKKA